MGWSFPGFEGRSVVVTGGASGIGAAVCHAVVAAGGDVAVLDLDETAGSALCATLGPSARFFQADVLDEPELETVLAAVVRGSRPLIGLVNCAGAPPLPAPAEGQPLGDWTRVLTSHLTGSFLCCKVFGGAMVHAGEGAVVNLSSVVALRPGPVLAYGAAKAGVVNLTQALAAQWASRGVRVNAVAPGWTDTPFLRPRERQGERDLAPILAATPQGRLMRPEEIAGVILFLLSPLASAVTGAVVPCDGGYLAGSGWQPYGGWPQATVQTG